MCLGSTKAGLETSGLGWEKGKCLCLIARFGGGSRADSNEMARGQALHGMGSQQNAQVPWSREHSGIGSPLFCQVC